MPVGIHTEPYNRFRALLIAKRKAARLTQSAVAGKLSKHQSFVAKYENGERRLDVVEFVEVAEAIGFDPAAFLRAFIEEGAGGAR